MAFYITFNIISVISQRLFTYSCISLVSPVLCWGSEVPCPRISLNNKEFNTGKGDLYSSNIHTRFYTFVYLKSLIQEKATSILETYIQGFIPLSVHIPPNRHAVIFPSIGLFVSLQFRPGINAQDTTI